MLLNLKTGLSLRGGHALRNRVVVPPMASETADERGFVTDRTVEHYARLARSGAGIVMVEYTYVQRDGRSEPNQLGVDRDAQVEGLARVVSAIHEAGERPVTFLQLTHAGGKSERALTGGELLGPSDVAVPAKDRELEAPRPMALAEVQALRDAFVQAARRAQEAGFDGVELHAAHGYGLNQWLSPLTNRRVDAYSAGPALLYEVVEAIRARCPELLISIRFPGQDNLEGGLTTADMQEIAQGLEARGVALLNVSSGLGGWRRPRDSRGEGYLVGDAARIQEAVLIPVIGVGGIETAAYINESLALGRFSLAAVGRAILKDPEAWGQSLLSASKN